MIDKKSQIFLEHILESIKLIEEYIGVGSKENFYKNNQVKDSVVRRIEVIGEAVKNLPEELMVRYSQVPWKEIVGARDKMIHRYFGIDVNIVWDIVKKDLPVLKKEILKIKEEMKVK